jgi:replicative DNA helicase
MSKPNFVTGADVLDSWREDVLKGTQPTFYKVGIGELERIEIGPKLVTLIGGAPAAGKTAFVMQCVIDALRINTELTACICNVEMPPEVLFDRQLARLSGVDVQTIRYRRLEGKHGERIDKAMGVLDLVRDRLCFVRPPFNLENIAAVFDDFKAGLIVLDYIQRIAPPGDHGDKRSSVDATMNHLRQFSDAGAAVIAVAAVGRTKDSKGRSSYDGDGLNLASFRESSELEFGADDAFILVPHAKEPTQVVLRHLKARHTEPKDLTLNFDRSCQRFTPMEASETPIAKAPLRRV